MHGPYIMPIYQPIDRYHNQLFLMACSMHHECSSKCGFNCLLNPHDYMQASLPVSHGAWLGVCSAVMLAPCAFLASAAGCRTLTKQILPPLLHNSPVLDTSDAVMLWSSTTLEPPPTSPSDVHQRAWDKHQTTAILNSHFEKATDPVSRARLLGVSPKNRVHG